MTKECINCGSTAELEALRRAGYRSRCPERDMRPRDSATVTRQGGDNSLAPFMTGAGDAEGGNRPTSGGPA